MLQALSQRVLPALQLTRIALVFTAISNSLCTYLLAIRQQVAAEASPIDHLDPWSMFLIAMISTGLYGFGMSLNDIADRRRDRELASHRPLASGHIGLQGAYAICIGLGVLAIIAAVLYGRSLAGSQGWISFGLAVWTGLLIVFYDLAGKYLVAPGLLSLGLIRFFHALIPAPHMPLLWHPLLLFTHVTILSSVAYAWENKRPMLTRVHVLFVAAGVVLLDLGAFLAVWWRCRGQPDPDSLWPSASLLLPAGALVGFGVLAWGIRQFSSNLRTAGQRLMLAGLLYLIVYDASFVSACLGWVYGLCMLGLLPVSYLAVRLIRAWSVLVLLSQPPTYIRHPGQGSRREVTAGDLRNI